MILTQSVAPVAPQIRIVSCFLRTVLLMNSLEQLQEAEQALLKIFSGIDQKVKQNLQRVLAAFRHHSVGAHHFAGVTGYGHDDLGREVLDKVFAEIMGAQAAMVRVQFVSGTHAIACALFGVLRPGDEILAVAGADRKSVV